MVNIIVVLTSDHSKQTAEATNICQGKLQPLCGEGLSQSVTDQVAHQSSRGFQPQANNKHSTQRLLATPMQMITQGVDKSSAAQYVISLRSALLVTKLISLTQATKVNSSGSRAMIATLWSTLVVIGHAMQQQPNQENAAVIELNLPLNKVINNNNN